MTPKSPNILSLPRGKKNILLFFFLSTLDFLRVEKLEFCSFYTYKTLFYTYFFFHFRNLTTSGIFLSFVWNSQNFATIFFFFCKFRTSFLFFKFYKFYVIYFGNIRRSSKTKKTTSNHLDRNNIYFSFRNLQKNLNISDI